MRPPSKDPGTLILVDCSVTLTNSALKAMVKALPALLDEGWKVRVWSSVFDPVDPRITWEKIPQFSRTGFIQFLFLSVYTVFRYFWQRLAGRLPAGTLIQSNGASLIFANVVHIQFVSIFYLAMAEVHSKFISLRFRERAMHTVAGWMERCMWLLRGRRRAWIVCSEHLAGDLQKKVRAPDLFEILPNSYDPTRFNRGIARQARPETRTALKLAPEELVFAFVCTGAFDRKGLPAALRICHLLIEQGLPCRLLVIGGISNDPPVIDIHAAKAGVSDTSFVLCHGRTPKIPELLSAADALLFPSFFEAFANVEIEAAALGLRLYLTPHYGSEMIIRPGANGVIIPWDPVEAAGVIAEEIRSGAILAGAVDCGRALQDADFAPAYAETLQRIQGYLSEKS